MKKIILLFALFLGIHTVSNAQSAGGKEKVSGEKTKKVRGESKSGARKPRKQMKHFRAREADKRVRSNGTAYRYKRKREAYHKEGNGY